MKLTSIGRVDFGTAGHDFYYHVELDNEDLLEIEGARANKLSWLSAQLDDKLCFEGSGTGHLFCESVSQMPFPHSEHRFVAVAHIRSDC